MQRMNLENTGDKIQGTYRDTKKNTPASASIYIIACNFRIQRAVACMVIDAITTFCSKDEMA